MLFYAEACSLLFVLAIFHIQSGTSEILAASEFLKSACEGSQSECQLAVGTVWTVRSGPAVLPKIFTFMTAHDSTSDVPASRNASSIAELSLGEQSSLFSVPANGTVELRGLRIIDVTLPSAPFPLPASGFLALSAFRLGAGARLRLVDSFLTVPSCALLSLHQTYACGVSPSPNVTVTPSSLVVHRLTTPSLDATNVTVQCSGAAAPYPCLAESFPGQVPLLSYMQRASQTISVAARTYGGTPPPVYGFLTRDMALVDPAAARYDTGGGAATCGNGSSGSNGTAAGDAPQQLLGDPDTVGPQRAPEASSACAAIAWGNRLVLAGDGTAQQRTVLDLAHSTSMLYLQVSAIWVFS